MVAADVQQLWRDETRLEKENTSLKVQWSWFGYCLPQFEKNYLTDMCSGSEAGSYSRLIDFMYLSTLSLGVMKKKKKKIFVLRMCCSCGGI